jgi:alpha,alpha-trehalose-phosphate synthase [UDP-forming]/trehalose-phosphatase
MREPTNAPEAPPPRPWLELARATELAVLVDLDGTLIPFAPTVEEAPLDDATASELRALTAVGVRVVVVTGRPRAAVDASRASVPDAWWFAEHGAWRWTDDAWQPPRHAAELGDLARRLTMLAEGVPGARVEHKSLAVGLHWRRVADDARPALVAAAELTVDEWLEAQPDFERLDGSAVIEVRHRAAHKGTAVTWLRARLPDARMLALGDDVTDEDAFAALGEHDAAVQVGRPDRHSHAAWWVEDPPAARALLRWLAAARDPAVEAPPPPVNARPHRALAVPDRALVIISNRTPAAGAGRGKEVGGLVSALAPSVARTDGIWLGWSGSERAPGLTLTIDDAAPPARATFDYPPGWREPFYAGFCNQSLWPLLHCFPSRVRYVDDEWTAYVLANEAYARLATRLAAPTATIWVHDYHLMLVGAALRHLGHQGPLGFFLHVPFPPRDVWETLPWHAEVIDALLSFDRIGFHTARWADNFLGAIGGTATIERHGTTAVVRRGGRVTSVGVHPIGIEPAAFEPAGDDLLDPDVAGLRAQVRGRQLILGVDRLDYSKGIPERLEAFRRLLQLYPGWRGKVSFVQVSVPSRAEVPEYAELRRRVEELVGRINGEFGEADWVPVRYLYRSYPPPVLAQLYRLADVGLITPLRDGMNLVAKEFVVAQRPTDPAALVLSRFAGAAEELDAAVLTNPYHVDGVALDLDRALAMTLDERQIRHAALLAAATRVTSTSWAEDFLAALDGDARSHRAAG